MNRYFVNGDVSEYPVQTGLQYLLWRVAGAMCRCVQIPWPGHFEKGLEVILGSLPVREAVRGTVSSEYRLDCERDRTYAKPFPEGFTHPEEWPPWEPKL